MRLRRGWSMGNMKNVAWLKIGVEFIKTLAGQWNDGSTRTPHKLTRAARRRACVEPIALRSGPKANSALRAKIRQIRPTTRRRRGWSCRRRAGCGPNVIGQNNTSENNTTGIISSNLTGAQSSLEAVNDTSAVNYAENQSAK